MSRDFLLEIGTEELPAGFIEPALDYMATRAARDLAERRLACGDLHTFGTPRRLALLVEGLATRQAERVHEAKGPSKKVAFDDEGAPTRAALGFARGQGVAVADLQVRPTEQGEYVFAVTREAGAPAADVLREWLPEFVAAIPFPKSMRWGEASLRFARPVRWLVAMFGDEPVPFSVGGVTAGRLTRGHRFLAPEAFDVGRPSDYVERLRDAFVLADVEERKAAVARAVEEAARSAGGRVVDDGALIDEVAHLVEYPVAVVGGFAPEYLDLPGEVLITPMREHQRYFPLADEEGGLLPRFVAVSNGPRPDPDVVRRGNEKVLEARLADARFFYDEDRKEPLRRKVDGLRDVVFQQRLGSVYDKTVRIGRLAETLAQWLALEEDARRAAREGAALAKADLVTLMVHEFPELQGIVGREYARLSGESDGAADVIFEHYLPRHAGDRLPSSDAGRVVSIADKVDTIVGCFGVGLAPTGSQDPFALRRQALGVLRIVLDGELPLRLSELLARAYDLYDVPLAEREETLARVDEFFRQRLRGVLADKGLRSDVAEAVIAVAGDEPTAAARRAAALQRFIEEEEDFSVLLTAYERVVNLARRSTGRPIDPALFSEEAEAGLYAAVEEAAAALPGALRRGAEEEALRTLAALGPPVDRLFEDVMVMAKDEEVRQNRLALLRRTLDLFHAVARFDAVVVSGT